MRKLKRGLAAVLSALLLTALLPVNALATDGDNLNETVSQENVLPPEGIAGRSGEAQNPETESQGVQTLETQTTRSEILPETENEPEDLAKREPVKADDEVVYNLLDQEITVGYDADEAEAGERPYVLFEEDGDYAIELWEEDPFFPYEVQFIYEGKTTEEWFMDEDDEVEIGGHTFTVEVMNGNANYIHLEIGGETIPAMPEEKTFTNNGPSAAPASLLPLQSQYLTIWLDDYFYSELKKVRLDTVLGRYSSSVGDDDAVLWAKIDGNDNFTIADKNAEIDLTPSYAGSTSVSLELIVGTADQLDPSNARYIVTAYLPDREDLLNFAIYNAEGESIEIYQQYFYKSLGYFTLSADKTNWTEEAAYLSMDKGSHTALSSIPDSDIDVYAGYYTSVEEIEAKDAEPITSQIWKTTGKDGYAADYQDLGNKPEFTVVIRRDGEAVEVFPFAVYVSASSWTYSLQSIYKDENGIRSMVADIANSRRTNGIIGLEYEMLQESDPVDGSYYFGLTFYAPDPNENVGECGIDMIECAYVGNYASREDVPEDAVDIKTELISSAGRGNGYKADYSQGVTFTIFFKSGDMTRYTVKTVPYADDPALPAAPTPLSQDTYFRMERAWGAAERTEPYNYYVMKYEDDSYYYNGYQTVFLLDSEDQPLADGTEIYPQFAQGNKVTVFAGHNEESGEKQISSETPVTFESGKAIPYSAAAENGTHLKNYWVTFLTRQTGGAELFVNGATNSEHKDDETGYPIREVYLDDAHGNHHDIFIANIGDADLTGLTVTLDAEAQKTLKLDPYWTINATTTLKSFDNTDSITQAGGTDSYGELMNVAKIRLIPTDQKGEIGGTLTIGSANGGAVTIKLTGVSGIPKITTESLLTGVKYVPYSSLIQTNNMYDPDAVEFEVVAGTLPAGVVLKPNGELYGAPRAFGAWTFTVRAVYKGDTANADEKQFTLEILDNTNVNVWNATDGLSYEITTPVGVETAPPTQMPVGDDEKYFLLSDYQNSQEFVTEGLYGYYIDFWLDGRRLEEGTEYTAESGSTKITILSQTIQNAGNGKHTISAEFREGDPVNGTLKRAAQNYYIQVVPASSGSSSGSSRPSGSSVSAATVSDSQTAEKEESNTSKNSTSKPEAGTFIDCARSDWFYNDVQWAYEKNLMVGVSDTRFAPNDSVTQAIVVSVLARMSTEDLDVYTNETEADIPAGQWYTSAAIWAKRGGLLPDYSKFSSEGAYARGQMAIMLTKYLRRLGFQTELLGEDVVFADADQMSAEENRAFQILYYYEIFQGVGNLRMNPTGTTSRAEFAALIYRINSLVES